jgi:copper resistance protein B
MRNLLLMATAGGLMTAAATSASAQNQADAYYPPEEMAAARETLLEEAGGVQMFYFQANRLEYQARRDSDELVAWDVNAWYGGRVNRIWWKSEAEYDLNRGAFADASLQALYSRAISPYFDLQVGLRQDFEPDPMRTHAVVGIQGLAPYWFELNGALYLSDQGELTGQFESEYELRLSQRLYLQPRVALSWSAEDIPELEIGSGIGSTTAGLRLRYEVLREFAPYFGVEWSRTFGVTEDYARAAGARTQDTAVVAGIRIWF